MVVGSGPNGLAAAIALARAGRTVRLLERNAELGGSVRSSDLGFPGFVHDTCASVFPMAIASPFLRSLQLERHGLEWIHPPACAAHPLDEGRAALLWRSLDETAAGLGLDGEAWRNLVRPFAERAEDLFADILAPPHWPRHPALLLRFGLPGIQSAAGLARRRFREPEARALFAGLAAHAVQPLEKAGTAAFGLLFALLAPACGWPIVRGGAQRLTEALAAEFVRLGGAVETGREVADLGQLPPARAVLLDVTPRQWAAMAGKRLPSRARARLGAYRYGPAVYKIDWILSGPIPWSAPACAQAATVHVGGALEEVAAAEAAVGRGQVPPRPFVLVVQPSLFDPARAPAGMHTAWGYCHVPLGSGADLTGAIESQVERFAPGFRARIQGRHVFSPPTWEAHNPNCVGGDIMGGSMDLRQLLLRPRPQADPYATELPGVYLCSASTPPGGGVHGLGGWFAARAALRRELR
ncbi:MAG TPA: NAD(P)/FAD-dependent oxidoreductase [Opitutaceae bacterium]|nr:NAD(P)/FAD-dependent oxidoreductase [Opitutaceae bacterium]